MYQFTGIVLIMNMPKSVRMMPWHPMGLHCHTHYHS